MLRRAALAALRGSGRVRSNPLVGCVIATRAGVVLGIGHHRRFGEHHAETDALRACRLAGHSAREATAWVTLEPCNHTGKTGPCTDALLDAGIARVVIARPDLNPIAQGGAARLRSAGVHVDFIDGGPLARRLVGPFEKHLRSALPWVTLKWAQTIDGRIATASGHSKWISSAPARRLVHRWRGRVDAILTGIGTVLADDPLLTCRDVPARTIARRVVIDPRLRLPRTSALLATLAQAPLTVVAQAGACDPAAADHLRSLGVEVLVLEPTAATAALPLRDVLLQLARVHGVRDVMVEAGPGLAGHLLRDDLADEALVFIAPLIAGDRAALPPADIGPLAELANAPRWTLTRCRQRGPDALLLYQRDATTS